MIRETMKHLDAGAAGPKDEDLPSLSLETNIVVALDPTSGRPHRARYERQISGVGEKRTEIRDVEFQWSRAQGCKPAP
jgi:hypothetical protein